MPFDPGLHPRHGPRIEVRKASKDGAVGNLVAQNTSPSARSNAKASSQRANVFYINDFLRVGVAQVARSEEGRWITIALTFENLTNDELLLGLAFGTVDWGAQLVDDLGNSHRPKRRGGVSGIAGIRHGKQYESPGRYSAFSARSSSTVVFTFEASSEKVGTLYSFAGNFRRWENGNLKRFPIGIANIELPN